MHVDVLQATGLGLVTALATGLGVFPVYWMGVGARGIGFLWGTSAGVMAAISVLDLLLPSVDELVPLAIGVIAGVLFVLLAADRLHARGHARDHDPDDGHGDEHTDDHSDEQSEEHSGDHGDGHEHDEGHVQDEGHVHDDRHQLGASRISSLSLLVFLVFTVHSAPEGVGIGAALRQDAITGLVVVIAIALHNIPEGTAVAVGLRQDGVPVWKAAGWAVVTSLPQPLLAPLVFLVAVGPLLPAGMGFAGGAMLALVVREVLPAGHKRSPGGNAIGVVVGLAIALALQVVLPVPGGI